MIENSKKQVNFYLLSKIVETNDTSNYKLEDPICYSLFIHLDFFVTVFCQNQREESKWGPLRIEDCDNRNGLKSTCELFQETILDYHDPGRQWFQWVQEPLRGTGSFSPQEALQVVDEIRVVQPEVELKQKLRLLN